MGLPVNPPSEQLGVLTAQHIADLTTSRQRISLPSGALWVNLHYLLLPGATATTGQYARFVVNAASDSDADGRLTHGPYFVLGQDHERGLSATAADPITRIDVIAAVAAGLEKTILSVTSGVRS